MQNKKKLEINGGYPLHSFDDIREIYSLYIHDQKERDLVKKAYEYAKEKHQGVYRKTGEPYIQHPLEVVYILARLQSGPQTLAAGFLHDVVEDTDTPIETIGKEFDLDVQFLVDALTKIQRLKLSHKDRISLDAEDHRKIFLGMAKDIRVILIKLSDRLHNMRTVDSLSDERIKALSQETLDVFVPIAHRLGIYAIQSELEDLCLKHLKPEIYQTIKTSLDKKMKYRKESLKALMKRIADMLFEKDIPFTIMSRVKSIYSIYKKIYLKGKTFDEIYDILAIRIITDTELRCYEILGLIHAIYAPIPGRFKDYIAVPKENMYQSLHTSIVSGDGQFYEIQIRTEKMDEIAETGIAAHWKYKEGDNSSPKQAMKEIEEKLHWFRDFLAMSETNNNEDAKDYIKNLRHDIFESSVYVLTPQGKVIDLPNGATPLDFAYKIHTKVGDQAVGAIVNNIMVPLNTVLKSGDVVEIKTNPNSSGPNEGWLKIAKSTSALSHIRKALQKKNASMLKEERIQKGKETLLNMFIENGFNEDEMMEYIDNKRVLDNFSVDNVEDLFANISSKNPSPNAIFEFLKIKKKNEAVIHLDKVKEDNSTSPVTIGNEVEIAVNLGNCCTPIPGDDIVGYITKGKGVTIHRISCPNISHHPERLVDAEWRDDLPPTTYPVDIIIEANDRNNLLSDIMGALSQHNIKVSSISAHLNSEKLTTIIASTIHVSDSKRLHDIFNVLLNVTGVFDVTRIVH